MGYTVSISYGASCGGTVVPGSDTCYSYYKPKAQAGNGITDL